MKANDLKQDVAVHTERRRRLAAAVGEGVAVIPTAPERLRNRDSHYPYRFDSYFYYLTGFQEPEAVLVVVGGAAPRSILYCREKNPEREIWDGFRHGQEGARERFDFDEAHAIAALDEAMPALLADRAALWYPVGADAEWDARAMRWLNAVRANARAGVAAPQELHDVRAPLDEMRLLKDAHELALMRGAAAISAAAHRRAMLAARPGRHEYEVEAELLHEFRVSGAQFPAYSPIVAGGAHACILHYVQNDAPLAEGDLLLIDAGCELEGYAADITRTFPVNGRFSGAQREVYEIVLAAQRAAMAKVRAGSAWNEPHDAAVRVLAQGMLDLKLLQGGLDEVLEKETYKRFYMHRTGHWLGLDVHDAGDYKRAGAWRPLTPGMTLTVEPGLYIRAAEDVPERLRGIGVRIEDDVLVTQGECEVLTAAAPKAIAEIEALIRDGRR
ncbi:MAG: aminopeptidase P N-terminal domain-containing protein [Betaproteobacteria bacterium]|nr:aminopeptidase P N-terminal domain-containing protein [Betaproteobacteria bacterium]